MLGLNKLTRWFSIIAAGLFNVNRFAPDTVIKRDRTANKSKHRTWSFVQSNRDGTALWQCRQTGEYEVKRIKKDERMAPHEWKHFFGTIHPKVKKLILG